MTTVKHTVYLHFTCGIYVYFFLLHLSFLSFFSHLISYWVCVFVMFVCFLISVHVSKHAVDRLSHIHTIPKLFTVVFCALFFYLQFSFAVFVVVVVVVVSVSILMYSMLPLFILLFEKKIVSPKLK